LEQPVERHTEVEGVAGTAAVDRQLEVAVDIQSELAVDIQAELAADTT